MWQNIFCLNQISNNVGICHFDVVFCSYSQIIKKAVEEFSTAFLTIK